MKKRVIKRGKEGSLTVEAALVLPIFLFGVLFFLYFFQLLFLQDSIQSGITEAGRFLSRYENFSEEKGGSGLARQLILKQRFYDYLDEKSINANCIVGGVTGIWVGMSEEVPEEIIDIMAVYQIQFPIPFFGEKTSLIKQRVRTRAFVGKEIKKQLKENNSTGVADEEDEHLVYVTENGSVYHESENCTHLKLSISKIDKTELETARNENGGKYKACEKCMDNKSDETELYIAKEGDRYHSALSCSGLKRTVHTVSYSKVKELQKCSRCG